MFASQPTVSTNHYSDITIYNHYSYNHPFSLADFLMYTHFQ